MSQRPPPSLVGFAGRLLRYEIDKAGLAEGLADGFRRLCQALHGRLAPLISSTGFQTLFARAHKLAARDFPLLGAVSISAESDWSVAHLLDSASHSEQQVAEALAALLAHFIWLLVTFIGGNLGLGTVAEMWPEVPFDVPNSDMRSSDDR